MLFIIEQWCEITRTELHYHDGRCHERRYQNFVSFFKTIAIENLIAFSQYHHEVFLLRYLVKRMT